MLIPIFPSCSYLIIVGGTPDQVHKIREAAMVHRCRSYHCPTIADFTNAELAMRWMVGVIFFADALPVADVRAAATLVVQKRGLPTYILVSKPGFEPIPCVNVTQIPAGAPVDALRKVSDELFNGLLPVGLGKILTFAADRIFPTFFPEIGTFHVVPSTSQSFDRQVNFSASKGEVVGNCYVRFKLDQVAQLVPEDRRDGIGPILLESVNQALGVFVQNLVKLGHDFKIGLPTMFDLTKVPEIQTLVYFPSAHVIDSGNRLCMSLGFFNLSGGPLFDLSAAEPSDDSGEIDFL